LSLVARGHGFAAFDVHCEVAGRAWRIEAPAERRMDSNRHMLVLVRRGRYLTRAESDEVLADRGSGFLERPGLDRSFRHVDDEPDRSTAVLFSWAFLEHLAGAALAVPSGPVAVTPRLHLAHRRLLDAAEVDAEERVADVLRSLAESAGHGGGAPRRESPSHRRIARLAAEALQHEPSATTRLTELAALVGVSSWHLSRVFHRYHGVTIGRYRTNLRLISAIEELRAGEQNLVELSVRHGFADQAHFTRCLSRAVGLTPSRLARQRGWPPGTT
jgi:AraC-like DNA-binding protein